MKTILFDLEQGSPTKKALKKDLKESEKIVFNASVFDEEKTVEACIPSAQLSEHKQTARALSNRCDLFIKECKRAKKEEKMDITQVLYVNL